MIRSMTGFARRERQGPWGTLACELRSVNHRYLELSLRLPDDLRSLEGDARQLLGATLKRGKVEAGIYLRGTTAASTTVEINRPLIEQLLRRAAEVSARLRAKVAERVAQLGVQVDPERLEQELVLIAYKMDVQEELDRLGSHIDETLQALDSKEPAGRRLDFLMQELNREANTLSSKSQDMETTRAAVDIKVLIEQMREQVQNVE